MSPDGFRIENSVARWSPALFAFWIVIVLSAYTTEIGGCEVRRVFDNNSMLPKHILGSILMYFAVVVVSPQYAYDVAWKNVLLTASLYAVFMLTTRMPFWYLIFVLTALSVVYQLDDMRQKSNDPTEVNRITQRMSILSFIAMVVFIVGVVVYYMERRIEYGDQFSLWRFIVGNLRCQNVDGLALTNRRRYA